MTALVVAPSEALTVPEEPRGKSLPLELASGVHDVLPAEVRPPAPGGPVVAVLVHVPVSVVQAASELPRLPEPLEELLEDVCRAFGVYPHEVRVHGRLRSVVDARHVFWRSARRWWGKSFPELGRLLGGPKAFDHTTVMSGVQRIEAADAKGTELGLVARRFLPPDRPLLRIAVDEETAGA